MMFIIPIPPNDQGDGGDGTEEKRHDLIVA
jgi:hypothetical protein